MKHLLIVLLYGSLLLANETMQAQKLQWEKIGKFPDRIGTVCFLDENFGLVSVSTMPNGSVSPCMFRTTDGGTSWEPSFVELLDHGGYGIQDILMINRDTGYACGHCNALSSIWKTTDGGRKWLVLSDNHLLSVCIRKTRAGLLVSDFDNNSIRLSADGITFTPVVFNHTPDCFLGMDFSDSLHGVLVGSYRNGNGWYVTDDGGITWKPTVISMESWSIYAQQHTPNFFAVPEEWSNHPIEPSSCYRSTDYGNTWNIVSHFPVHMTGGISGLKDILYAQSHMAPATSSGVYRSIDSGVTWTNLGGPNQFSDTRLLVLPISCTKAAIIVGGDDGALYKAYDNIGFSKYPIATANKQLCTPTDTIDLGFTSLCSSQDTSLTISNEGYDTVHIFHIQFNGIGFKVGDTTCLIPPSGILQIPIKVVTDSSNHTTTNNGTLTISSDATISCSPILLSRSFAYPKEYTIHFSANKFYGKNQTIVAASILADSLPSDLTTIDAKLFIPDKDLLSFEQWKSPNSVSINGDHIFISGNPIKTNKDTIATFYYKVYLTDDTIGSLILSDMYFNSTDPEYSHCVANIHGGGNEMYKYLFSCSEPTIAALLKKHKALISSIYPNPSHATLSLRMTARTSTAAQVMIFDLFGKQLATIPMFLQTGTSELPLNISSYPIGIYSIVVQTAEESSTNTFIKE